MVHLCFKVKNLSGADICYLKANSLVYGTMKKGIRLDKNGFPTTTISREVEQNSHHLFVTYSYTDVYRLVFQLGFRPICVGISDYPQFIPEILYRYHLQSLPLLSKAQSLKQNSFT